MESCKEIEHFINKCNLVMNHHLLRQKVLVATVRKSANNCIGYNGQKFKNRDFRKFRKIRTLENRVSLETFSVF